MPLGFYGAQFPIYAFQEILDFLTQVGILIMQWPPKSPDPNRIVHVIVQLENAVITECEQTPQDFIQNLTKSTYTINFAIINFFFLVIILLLRLENNFNYKVIKACCR